MKAGMFKMNQKVNPGHDTQPPGSARKRHISLQMQFQIVLGIVFLIFCVLTAYLIYIHEKKTLEQNALTKSRMVMAAVESTRAYVREVLRPKMYDTVGTDHFILEAMSTSYVTRAVMDRFNENLPEYRYRRVSTNARNPVSDPSRTEMELIGYFRERPSESGWQGIRDMDGTIGYIHVRPIYMRASCLRCHGRPEEAPATLLDLYGERRGFGFKEGDLAGVMAVSIPVNIALQKIRGKAMSVFWVTIMLLTCLYVMTSYVFNRMVVRSLAGVLDIFRSGLMEAGDRQRFEDTKAQVEIRELTQTAQDMTAHLHQAREVLRQHTVELEVRVAKRTRDLEDSRARLSTKVEARNRELHTLNRITELITRSYHLEDQLPVVLEQTLALIPAKGAGIYLLADRASEPRLRLEYHRNAGKLDRVIDPQDSVYPPARLASLPQAIWNALEGNTNIFACHRNDNCLNIPLSCRGRVLGVMTFVGVDFHETTAEQQTLLESIGHQIGITVESLQNIAALVRNKELLQSIIDGIPDGMVLLDRNLVIRMVNRAFLTRYGWDLEMVLNTPCRDLAGGDECPLAGAQLETALATRRQTKEEVNTEAGEIFMIYYYPILDEDDQVWGILRYAKDITLERQVEQRIQQTEKMAALGQLAAGVAHEINNPMSVILCYTNLLRRQLQDNGQTLQDVAIIEKQANNCQRIVSDLLNFSRTQPTAPRLGHINDTVREVVGLLRHQFRTKGTTFDLKLADDMPRIPIDMNKIKQVFLNLFMNAFQAFGGKKGEIRVATFHNDRAGTIDVTVEDDGPGIPAEIREKIFDPFFSTKQTGEGTGLGLSVSYGIVTDHGGKITVISPPGQGTRFVVSLPVVPIEETLQ